MNIKLAASITSASYLNLEKTIKELISSGIDIIHFDIEDGLFTPQLNSGIRIIEQLRGICNLPFDVHLMVNNPEWLIPCLAKCKIDMLSVHYEACPYPRRTLKLIQEQGMKAGLAFNPKTPFPFFDSFSPFLDFMLALSTEPESGKQDFIFPILEKISQQKKLKWVSKIKWEIDGGVNKDNIKQVVKTGINFIVAGRSIFDGDDVVSNINELNQIINSYG